MLIKKIRDKKALQKIKELKEQKKLKKEEKHEKKFKKIAGQKVKQELRAKKISILVFIWSALLFFLQLQYNFLDEYDVILFWLSILLMISTIIFQIFTLKNNKFVLFEIFIVYLFLHLIYQVGFYGLRGSDSYNDYILLKTILNNHNFVLEPGVQGYPMIHIFSSVISTITKIDPLLIAKFIPSIISSIIVLPIYMLAYNVYGDKRVALFSGLFFGTIPQFISFETSFVREVFGMFFMFLFFAVLIASRRKADNRFILLSLLLIPVVIFSHHFSSFLLISLLGIYFIVSLVILPYFYKFLLSLYQKTVMELGILSRRVTLNLAMVTFVLSVSLLSYVIHLYGIDFFPNFFQGMFYDILGVKDAIGSSYAEYMDLGSPIVTLKGNIIFYGFFSFNISFALILIIKFFTNNISQKIEDTTFILFYFYCMFIGFLTMFFLSGSIFPDRLLPFAFIFGSIPIISYMFILKKNMYKKILAVILISFIVLNLYNIDSRNYTDNASFTGGVATEKEYLIAKRISFPDEYYGYIGVVAAIYDVRGIEQRTGGKDFTFMFDFRNSSTMAVINEEIYFDDLINLKEKSKDEYFKLLEIISYKNDRDIHKIYDLGNIYVIKGSG